MFSMKGIKNIISSTNNIIVVKNYNWLGKVIEQTRVLLASSRVKEVLSSSIGED